MSDRKSIGKKLRFEVFKRDSFTCQYCGESAPNVVLQIDHIEPVVSGGSNDIINLVTACTSCNAGKGGRRLNDSSVVEKQREQLRSLQERKEQLEMMMQWHKSLKAVAADAATMAASHWAELAPGFVCSEDGKRTLAKWVKRYGFKNVLEAMDIAADAKLVFSDNGTVTGDSWVDSFDYIRRVLVVRAADNDNPNLRNVFYIRGILRRRFSYVNERNAKAYLEEAFAAGAGFEELKAIACSESGWTSWQNAMIELLESLDASED